jgi:hypothetical protein
MELQRRFESSDDLCAYMHATFGEPVILHFSMGKDSLSTWLQLRRWWKQIIPVYNYLIPGLGFVDKGLAYYEDFFQTKILQYPRDNFMWYLEDVMWQPPHRVETLWDYVPLPREGDYDAYTIEEDIRRRFNCWQAWTAQGMRNADSLTRRTAFKIAGPIRPQYRCFFPIYDWNYERMSRTIREAGVKLTVDYSMFNRSFDTPRARFLGQIKKHFPEDYERIRFWLPLIDAELLRRKYAAQAATPEEDVDGEVRDLGEEDDEPGESNDAQEYSERGQEGEPGSHGGADEG